MYDFKDRLLALVKAAFQLCDRRNQIAHGMVMNLGTYGYCLGPSNLQKTRWEREGEFGAAQYQYVDSDVVHYANQFELLQREVERLTATSKRSTRPLHGSRAPPRSRRDCGRWRYFENRRRTHSPARHRGARDPRLPTG